MPLYPITLVKGPWRARAEVTKASKQQTEAVASEVAAQAAKGLKGPDKAAAVAATLERLALRLEAERREERAMRAEQAALRAEEIIVTPAGKAGVTVGRLSADEVQAALRAMRASGDKGATLESVARALAAEQGLTIGGRGKFGPAPAPLLEAPPQPYSGGRRNTPPSAPLGIDHGGASPGDCPAAYPPAPPPSPVAPVRVATGPRCDTRGAPLPRGGKCPGHRGDPCGSTPTPPPTNGGNPAARQQRRSRERTVEVVRRKLPPP